jgi:hypothetical protein
MDNNLPEIVDNEDCVQVSKKLESLLLENVFARACFSYTERVRETIFLFLKYPFSIEKIDVRAISFDTLSLKEEIRINIGFFGKDGRLVDVESREYFNDTESYNLRDFDSQKKITLLFKKIFRDDDQNNSTYFDDVIRFYHEDSDEPF